MARSLSLRSKLTLALLLFAGVGVLASAAVGYFSGRDSLRARALDQLISLRTTKAHEVALYVETLRGHLGSLSADPTTSDALAAFADAADALPAPSSDSLLRAFYEREFVPRLATEGEAVAGAFMPRDPTTRALQTRYIARNPEAVGSKDEFAGPEDGTAYAEAHARFHPAFQSIAESFGYADVFLVGPDGRVVYTVKKETDFGTDLTGGPYSASGLAEAVAAAAERRGERYVVIEDFSFYAPSYGAPAAFLATPVSRGSTFLGVLAVQLPIRTLERIMTEGGTWEASGLGQTGETFLVGPDQRLRTPSRLYLADSSAYFAALRETGAGADVIRQIRARNSPVLIQPATSVAVERALAGESGVVPIPESYTGRPALSSYAPLEVEGLDWGIVTQMAEAEAFAPVLAFEKRILLTAAVLSLLLTLGAVWLSGWALRPVRRLAASAQRIAAGETGVALERKRDDELGELAVAMGAMRDRLRAEARRAEEERVNSESLLTKFLPDSLTSRFRDAARDGDDWNLAESVDNATVIVATLSGYESMMAERSAEEIVGALDALVQSFDLARLRYGVEKLRTAGDVYVGAVGVASPHLDHAQRGLGFAIEGRSIVRRFAAQSGSGLAVRVGVASGPVIAGIIGEDKLTFDLWGPTMGEAGALATGASPDEIVVSASVRERLAGAKDSRGREFAFTSVAGGWRLEEPESPTGRVAPVEVAPLEAPVPSDPAPEAPPRPTARPNGAPAASPDASPRTTASPEGAEPETP